MTAFQCPAGHYHLVPESTDARSWRCPVDGWMDVDEARRLQREAADELIPTIRSSGIPSRGKTEARL